MKFFMAFILISSLFPLAPVPVKADMDRIDAATQILDQMPGKIPASILNNAQGIAIIPGEVKAGFVFGGEFGGGVLVNRLPDGSWSAPALISLAGGSFGLQIGGEVRDVVLVLNSTRSANAIENGTFNLGGGASIVAGPVGADFAPSTERPDVYAYVSRFGAFAGVTVGGALLSMDFDANNGLYGVSDPLKMRPVKVPEQAHRFSCVMSRITGAQSKICS